MFVYFYFYFKTLEFVLDREVEIKFGPNADVDFFFDNENDMFATKEYRSDNPVNIWNAKTGVLVKELDVDAHPVVFIRSRYIAVAYGSEIRIYDKDDEFNLIATLDGENTYFENTDEENTDDENMNDENMNDENMDDNKIRMIINSEIVSLVFFQNRNQSLLVSGFENGTVKVWDAKTWSFIKTFSAHTDKVHSIVFDQNSLVATSSRDGTIKIWKTDTWDLVHTLKGGNDEVAFTHNNMLVVLKNLSSIQIWCSESWSLVKTLKATKFRSKGAKFYSIALSKSNLLAVACDGGKILIFYTKNWDLFQEIEAQDNIKGGKMSIDQNDVLSYRCDVGKVMKWKLENNFLNSIYNQ